MKTHTLQCLTRTGELTGERIDFRVVGLNVTIEWRFERQCGTYEKQPIDLAAWELGNLGVHQQEDGQYSLERARLIWNALVQSKGGTLWFETKDAK